MTENRRQIMPEVYLTHCPSDKFKTGLLSAQLITPLRADSASACALLPDAPRELPYPGASGASRFASAS